MSKLNKKSRDSIRPKYSVSPKIGIGREKQAQKTIDSVNRNTDINKRAMKFKSKMCSEAGLCDLKGQKALAKENRKMQTTKSRAEAIKRGSKVGPKKPKLKPGN